jgi:hypothetical protein
LGKGKKSIDLETVVEAEKEQKKFGVQFATIRQSKILAGLRDSAPPYRCAHRPRPPPDHNKNVTIKTQACDRIL